MSRDFIEAIETEQYENMEYVDSYDIDLAIEVAFQEVYDC